MVNSDSYLLQLHRKGLTLTDDYAAQLKSTIQELESEVNLLERQTSVFEAICRNFQRTLAVSKRALALRRAVLAPIHRLPHELLVVVFQHCIPPDYDNRAPLGDDVRWTLLRVCRSWKCVLEGTPTLWTNLVISPDFRPLTQPLKLYLSLSAEHPLWVTIVERDSELAFEDNWSSTFWKVLTSTMHRWQRLRIHCVSTPVDDIVQYLMPLHFPALEEVYIEAATIEADPDEPPAEGRSWLKDAPCLKRAILSFVEEQPAAWYPSCLTHMSAEQQDGDMLKSAFSSFPDLQELFLQRDEYSVPRPRFGPIRHDALTCLHASGITLQYLTLPSLKFLTIDDYEDSESEENNDISWADILAAFIRRSDCSLTDLRIVNRFILQERRMYTEVLPLIAPTLVMLDLALPEYSETEEIIRSLARTESSPGSLPYLKRLEVLPPYENEHQHHDGIDSFVGTLTVTLISLRDLTLEMTLSLSNCAWLAWIPSSPKV
ncbi:hypothetical protein CYLTODRAFT_456199 [Cylindrobasidium torrendii FP15055 ss-10]|uniref:Uncharacterized protein n=1 Tax=Cylindrobasidium torrendii FP15055 ss-10 TaxID=1314674 RepID=A0A0D7B4Y4_9AGAR|nr:hypothetical protein CYLTODRAFT_456199 [Cylindrobasidium torrendii FP15055 ss-10]